jgi:hypothetical protein
LIYNTVIEQWSWMFF